MTRDRPIFQARVGDELEPMVFAPLTRHQFALYCGGSGDHNPVHTDLDVARGVCGFDDVIGHGMLTMALAGRYLTALVPPAAIRSFSARFTGRTAPGDVLHCRGTIAALDETSGGHLISLELVMMAEPGRIVLSGKAQLDLPA